MREREGKRPTPNVQRPTFNVQLGELRYAPLFAEAQPLDTF